MKTKLTTIFKKSANTPPMWVCLLFALIISTNCWATVVTAIGTGTVTLNKDNTSDPAGPITNTYVIPELNNEVCIAFGTLPASNGASFPGTFVYSSGVEWSVSIIPGIYDIAVTYGTGAWGTRPFFDLYDGASKVAEIFHAPSGLQSGKNPTAVGHTGSSTIDLSSLNGAKTYTLKVTDGWGGAYGTCIGHISFTREEGLDDMVTADYLQTVSSGETTLPAKNSTNNTTNENISVVNQNVKVDEWEGTKYLVFDSEADYLDINIASGYRICGISTATCYDGNGEGQLNIKYSLSSIYDDSKQTGSVVRIRGGGGDNCSFGAAPETISMNKNDIPNHAKSARIYKTGTREWGIKLLRLKVSIIEDECTKKTASFEKEGTETGSAPGDIEVCEDGSFSIPGKGSLSKTGNVFAGWNDGSATYQEGDSYDMSGSNHTFTAVWNEFTVPTVTNLAVTEPVGQTVPLSWIIPGICDLSSPVVPKYQNNCTLLTKVYYPEGDSVGVAGNTTTDNQFGVAFEIPSTTTNLEWISFEYKGNFASNAHLWVGACDAASGANAYWEFEGNMSVRPTNASEFVQSKQFTPNRAYWDGAWVNNPISDRYLSQIAIYGNTSGSGIDGLKYAIRNVRYHCTTFDVDIDHIVLVRKEGGAPADPTDGTVLYSGTKSHFVDDSDAKEFGHTYYYRVFAFHEDGTYSASTAISHEIESVATCTVSFNIGEGAVGDAPAAITDKPVNGTVTIPSANALYKPFYSFAGWKKDGSEEAPLAAGATYTVTADDVTAENISFTAQWTEDNTTRRIPAEHILNYSNQSTSVATTDYWDVTDDNVNDVCLDMKQKTAEWKVFIKPGYYDISTICAVPSWGISYRLSIVDPVTDLQVKELFYEHTDGDKDHAIIRNLSKRFDLTDLVYGKQYIIRIKDTWENCGLLVHDININPVTPKEIPDETHFDKDNAFSAVTTATDMDIDGEAGNDELINLDRKYVEWDVKVTPGVYNVSLVYGAPQYSIKVSVALIDPENPESVIYLSKDGNHTYYYKSGSKGTSHHYTSTTKCDLTGIDGNKIYRLRISDEYGDSNYLRVKNLTFSPIAPEVISNVTDTRLDATNTIAPPAMVTDLDIDDDNTLDELMNLKNTNAEWLVTLQKGLYNVQLVYGAPYYGIKVAVKLIDPSGEESDRVMSIQGDKDYYDKSNPATTEEAKATTPHHYTSATKCALLDVSEDKTYKVRVADAYPDCHLRVSHVLFTPIAPLQIPDNETRLDASNVFVAPAMNGDRIDISNQKEAVWYAKITPIIYDFSLNYYAEAVGTKVRFGIVDAITGDTIFRDQQNKYNADHTTYTINSSAQDLQTALDADKVYKIFVKDNYSSTGSVPQINYLEMVHHAETHTRSGLRVGDFGTICLPYAVAAEDRNGADLFEIHEWDPNGASLTLSQLTDNENMVAGRPYIFQATAATATFSYYPEGDETGAGEHNGLIGSYVQALIQQNDDNYIIYNNKLYLVNSEAYVGEYRAYIHKQDQVQPAPAYRRRVTLGVNGAQVATDIDLINDPAQMTKYIENGHLFILRDGKLYNAQGQLVK